jgi:hypothetical protein
MHHYVSENKFSYPLFLSCSRFKFQFSLFNAILLNTMYLYSNISDIIASFHNFVIITSMIFFFHKIQPLDWLQIRCESSGGSIFLPILRVPSVSPVNFQNLPPVKKIKYKCTIKSWPTCTFCDQYFWKFPIWNSRADEKRREIRMDWLQIYTVYWYNT